MFYCSIIVVFKIIILVLNMHRYNGLITTDWFWHNGTYIIINGMSYKLNYRCSGLCVQSVSRCSDFGFVSCLFLFARRTSPPIIVQTSFLTHGAYYGQVMDIREYNIVFFLIQVNIPRINLSAEFMTLSRLMKSDNIIQSSDVYLWS